MTRVFLRPLVRPAPAVLPLRLMLYHPHPATHHHFLNITKSTTVLEEDITHATEREDPGQSSGRKSRGLATLRRKLPDCQDRHSPLCLPDVGTDPEP